MGKPDIKIRFKGIEILSKSMTAKPKEDFNDEVFNFDVNGQTLVQPQNKVLISILNINIREFNKENVLASISLACEFLIDNFEEVMLLPANNLYTIPLELDVLIKTMTISTSRGVLFSELKGTYLRNAILPIILLPTALQNQKEDKAKE